MVALEKKMDGNLNDQIEDLKKEITRLIDETRV